MSFMMNFKYIKTLGVFALVASLAACATIITGTTQRIDVQVIDSSNNLISDAKCKIIDGKGINYIVASNPGTITVTKGNGALTPMCTKAGYKQTSFGMGQSFNAVSIVNVLFWPGFIVDAATGAITEYPSHIVVYMEKK
jgi:hypothetical protein